MQSSGEPAVEVVSAERRLALIEQCAAKAGRPRGAKGNVFRTLPRAELEALREAGFSYRQIGKLYGVSAQSVRAVMLHPWRESW